MNKKSTFRRYTEAQAPADQSDWQRVTAMADADIDLSDNPPLTPAQWAQAVVKRGGVRTEPPKERLDMRVDADILLWFKEQGQGYQTQINAVLREYVLAQKKHRQEPQP
jgi:uncharacterized protein (DUF4415 family)